MSVARHPTAICLAVLLAAAVTLVYLPVARHPFIDIDDREYVSENPVVRGGLSGAGVAWAFGSVGYAHNWHPLTWLSHMADVTLFGVNPAGHHVINLLFHAANTLLLFQLLRRLTGVLWPAAAAAALFGVHPLHVESVAWVAERKDVLSTFLRAAHPHRLDSTPAAARCRPLSGGSCRVRAGTARQADAGHSAPVAAPARRLAPRPVPPAGAWWGAQPGRTAR